MKVTYYGFSFLIWKLYFFTNAPFFNFIGDSFRHTVLSKRLFETKSADINFCNLIAYTFLVSKVISHSKVDQNITNVSDLRDYFPFFAASFATWTNQKCYKDEKISL